MALDPQHAMRRLQELQQQILAAQRTLEALQTSIYETLSDEAIARWEQVLAENQRLAEQCSHGAQEVDSAHAALDAAVRASKTDPLTGLPNRSFLAERMAHDIAVAKRHGVMLAVYFLDLDGFKAVNDKYGHGVGDLLLRTAASRLVESLRASDTVCRIGGDEFIVLMPEVQQTDVEEMGRKILSAVSAPCRLKGHLLRPTASIGASLYPLDGEDADTLIQKADTAMYCAKKAKRRARHAAPVATKAAAQPQP